MKTSLRSFRRFLAVLLIAVPALLSGCAAEESFAPITPIKEAYEYTTTNRVYTHPAMLTVERQVEYLTLTIDDGFFFCDTTDTQQADEFINSQRTLLRFLRDNGVETQKLNYFAMDTDDSFSESEKKRAHIALPHAKSCHQVLITLQTLWGDYTDYGYLYALSNAIAAHLGWQTDTIEEAEPSALDAFFSENPAALNLLYPCFSEVFASAETVRSCKALSTQLLEKLDLSEALAKPITEQVSDFRALADAYAQELSADFIRQKSGYAYYGTYIPLKIRTTYAQHFIDRGYEDFFRVYQEERGDHSFDYFGDYRSIFTTVDIINAEITRSVAHFGLEDTAGVVAINWISADSSTTLFSIPNKNCYLTGDYTPTFDGMIYLTQIDSYLHEYFHHIADILGGHLDETWQAQAFAELGSAQSQHARHVFEWPVLHDEQYRQRFFDCLGREYRGGADDYYDAYDLLCFDWDSYELDYHTGGYAINSITHYLLDLYGEDTVTAMFLFPETVEDLTGKTWDTLEAGWKQHMAEKFAHLPPSQS